MIEIFAIGAAAAINGVAAKGLSQLFRSLARDVTNPAAAVRAHQVAYVSVLATIALCPYHP